MHKRLAIVLPATRYQRFSSVDGTGFLSREELDYAMKTLGDEMSKAEVTNFFKKIKFDLEQKIAVEDFLNLVLNRKC